MNHTVKQNTDNPVVVSQTGSNLLDYLIAAAMFAYAFLSFGLVTGNNTSTNFMLLAFLNMLVYFIAIFLYFGIARLAFKNRNYLLWGCAATAFVSGYLFGGLSSFWQLFSSFSMLLFAGAFVGRMTRSNNKQIRVYIIGMLPVIIFTAGMFIPIWQELMGSVGEYFAEVLETTKQQLLDSGFGADAVNKSLVSTKQMLDVFIRIIPAIMVLSAVAQFSIGYLLFIYLLERNNPGVKLLTPFRQWKIPFTVIPVVLVGLILRLIGGEILIQIGDNILAFLLVFYVVSGLALIEFYLLKFNFSLFFKILFYIMMFFTGVIGFFASGLLGFIDSFADWRKAQQLKLEKK